MARLVLLVVLLAWASHVQGDDCPEGMKEGKCACQGYMTEPIFEGDLPDAGVGLRANLPAVVDALKSQWEKIVAKRDSTCFGEYTEALTTLTEHLGLSNLVQTELLLSRKLVVYMGDGCSAVQCPNIGELKKGDVRSKAQLVDAADTAQRSFNVGQVMVKGSTRPEEVEGVALGQFREVIVSISLPVGERFDFYANSLFNQAVDTPSRHITTTAPSLKAILSVSRESFTAMWKRNRGEEADLSSAFRGKIAEALDLVMKAQTTCVKELLTALLEAGKVPYKPSAYPSPSDIKPHTFLSLGLLQLTPSLRKEHTGDTTFSDRLISLQYSARDVPLFSWSLDAALCGNSGGNQRTLADFLITLVHEVRHLEQQIWARAWCHNSLVTWAAGHSHPELRACPFTASDGSGLVGVRQDFKTSAKRKAAADVASVMLSAFDAYKTKDTKLTDVTTPDTAAFNLSMLFYSTLTCYRCITDSPEPQSTYQASQVEAFYVKVNSGPSKFPHPPDLPSHVEPVWPREYTSSKAIAWYLERVWLPLRETYTGLPDRPVEDCESSERKAMAANKAPSIDQAVAAYLIAAHDLKARPALAYSTGVYTNAPAPKDVITTKLDCNGEEACLSALTNPKRWPYDMANYMNGYNRYQGITALENEAYATEHQVASLFAAKKWPLAEANVQTAWEALELPLDLRRMNPLLHQSFYLCQRYTSDTKLTPTPAPKSSEPEAPEVGQDKVKEEEVTQVTPTKSPTKSSVPVVLDKVKEEEVTQLAPTKSPIKKSSEPEEELTSTKSPVEEEDPSAPCGGCKCGIYTGKPQMGTCKNPSDRDICKCVVNESSKAFTIQVNGKVVRSGP